MLIATSGRVLNSGFYLYRSVSTLGLPHSVQTIDPANVEHVLKSKVIPLFLNVKLMSFFFR
jgi:hypothetical protein